MNEQYNPETAKKQKVRLPLSAYLSYLLIATLLFTGVSFSKFASTGSAEDGARVAVGELKTGKLPEQGDDLSFGSANATASYEFYVQNRSEVALTYSIVVTLPEALPEGIMLYFVVDLVNPGGRTTTALERPEYLNENLILLPIVSEDRKVCTFKNIGTFMIGTFEEEDNYKMYFGLDADYNGLMRVWDETAQGYVDVVFSTSWDGTEENEYTDGPLSLNGIKISVIAEQID